MFRLREKQYLLETIFRHGLNQVEFKFTEGGHWIEFEYTPAHFHFRIIVFELEGKYLGKPLEEMRITYVPRRGRLLLDNEDEIDKEVSDWNEAVSEWHGWLIWLKKDYLGEDLISNENLHVIPQLANNMTEEEIIHNAAKTAAHRAEALGPKLNADHFVKEVVEASQRFRKPGSKIIFFNEAMHQVQLQIEEHRKTCKSGPNCAFERKYKEILYYIQAETEALPKANDAISTNQIPNQSTGLEKIFISHSSKDADIVEEIIDLIEIIGIKPGQIFCSSFQGYSIGLGQDFLQRIKDELNGKVLVLFIITPNFYSSPVCLCEMGAAWVKTSLHIPIVVPPLSYEDVKGVIPLTQGFKINEPLKWNILKEQLEEWFSIQHKDSVSVWERKRDKAIQVINRKLPPSLES